MQPKVPGQAKVPEQVRDDEERMYPLNCHPGIAKRISGILEIEVLKVCCI